MRESLGFQNNSAEFLKTIFREVEAEWNIVAEASDMFAPRHAQYAPRLDIAVGPFNIEPGNRTAEIRSAFHGETPSRFRKFIKRLRLAENLSPRCMLAIEIVYSGSSKHILGDITNASIMGLYGMVLASPRMLRKVERIFEYAKAIRTAGKVPAEIFTNVAVVSIPEFKGLVGMA